ncbi:uncharacterized protein I206_105583 [Kwoniella pini CBS 10737]|uniref:Uncharacterized protein n=1 Tax=Kwoniella pini CBS 10737 TaxID=1296096 RepID=A0AAJ8L8Q2_9TREE
MRLKPQAERNRYRPVSNAELATRSEGIDTKIEHGCKVSSDTFENYKKAAENYGNTGRPADKIILLCNVCKLEGELNIDGSEGSRIIRNADENLWFNQGQDVRRKRMDSSFDDTQDLHQPPTSDPDWEPQEDGSWKNSRTGETFTGISGSSNS